MACSFQHFISKQITIFTRKFSFDHEFNSIHTKSIGATRRARQKHRSHRTIAAR
jgi:hypothetical protein